VMSTQAWAEGQQEYSSAGKNGSDRRPWKQLFGMVASSAGDIQEDVDVMDDREMLGNDGETRGIFARCHVAEKTVSQAWHCQGECEVTTPGCDVPSEELVEPESAFLEALLGNCPAPCPRQPSVSRSAFMGGNKALDISDARSKNCHEPAPLECLLGNFPRPCPCEPSVAEAAASAQPEPCIESATLEHILGNCPCQPSVAEAVASAQPEPCIESATLEHILGNCPNLPGALP